MMESEIDFIVRRVLAGDIESYAEIVWRYQRNVMRVVAAMLFDRQESEDLIQKVFIRAYERLDQFQLGRDMAAWLNSIARNVVLTHLRTKRSATKHMQLYREWLAERLFDEAQGSDHDYAERCQKALAECMKELSANGRKILELRYAHNMSHRMISEALGRTADAVAKSLSRIREALRNCIRERLLVA